MNTTRQAAPFEDEPLGLKPDEHSLRLPVAMDCLPQADWQVLFFIDESSKRMWAWALPMMRRGADQKLSMRDFIERGCEAVSHLSDQLEAAIRPGLRPSQRLDGGGSLLIQGFGARHVTKKIWILKGDDAWGDAPRMALWIDEGLRRVFPWMAPMMGPWDGSVAMAAHKGRFAALFGAPSASEKQNERQASALAEMAADQAGAAMLARELAKESAKASQARAGPRF